MISLHRMCFIWFVCVGSFTVDAQIVSARVGSTAVLPCEWRDVLILTPHVQWSMLSETVFERKGVELYEGEGYKNRVDVPVDQLLEGNCSLVMKNIRLSDAGFYESYVSVKNMKRTSSTKWVLVQSIELSVEETPEESLQDISAAKEPAEEHVYLRLTDGAAVNHPLLQIILLSLLTCLRVLHF